MASIFRLTTSVDLENPYVGDLHMENGQFVYLDEGPDMLAQRIRSRLLWWQGEWYLDQRQGTPWSKILGKTRASFVEAKLRDLIERMPGVAAVNSLTVTIDAAARSAAIACEVTAVEGYTVTVTDLDVPYGVAS
jgi:hypothetical protein